jgi:PucR family transcriptional regulator, purine catabolism regulatory protein
MSLESRRRTTQWGNAALKVAVETDAAIINRQFEQLRKVEAISRDFTSMLLRGVDLRMIVEHLARIVVNPVVLEDVAHQVVDFADSGHGLVEEILCSWESHSRGRHQANGGSELGFASSPRCVCAVVRLRDEDWGRLHVIELGKPLDEVDRGATDWAATAISVTLMSRQNVTAQTEHARRSFLGDILQSRVQGPKQLFHRARNLGADLEGRQLVTVVLGAGNLDELVTERGYTEHDRQAVREALLDALRSAADRDGVSILPGLDGDRALAILGVPISAPTVKAVSDVARAAVKQAERGGDDLACFIGISEQATVVSLRRAFDQATEAFEYGVRVGQPGVHHYADLGVHHLLLKMSDSPDLARFVESELRPLLEHDARGAICLLPTLRQYIMAGQNKSVAARALHIDRRTLYQRLSRIESVLGKPLAGHETTFRLAFAIQGLEVLQGRVSAAKGQVGYRPSRHNEAFLR